MCTYFSVGLPSPDRIPLFSGGSEENLVVGWWWGTPFCWYSEELIWWSRQSIRNIWLTCGQFCFTCYLLIPTFTDLWIKSKIPSHSSENKTDKGIPLKMVSLWSLLLMVSKTFQIFHCSIKTFLLSRGLTLPNPVQA